MKLRIGVLNDAVIPRPIIALYPFPYESNMTKVAVRFFSSSSNINVFQSYCNFNRTKSSCNILRKSKSKMKSLPLRLILKFRKLPRSFPSNLRNYSTIGKYDLIKDNSNNIAKLIFFYSNTGYRFYNLTILRRLLYLVYSVFDSSHRLVSLLTSLTNGPLFRVE